MLRYDLHSHSTYSDGLLSPADLVARAASRRVDVLALTDHDDVAGLREASDAANEHRLRFVPGAELSVSWEDQTVHVVALRIDAANPRLVEGLQRIRIGRSTRARRIGESLACCGIEGAYEGALRYVPHEGLVTRSHFARYLVEAGHAPDVKSVFGKFLVPGKPGYVEHDWATLPEAIDWIHGAGGQAVLAHPARYPIAKPALRRLLSEFRDLGGDGIEVLSSAHDKAEVAEFASLARAYGFLASVGSDFHGPGESTIDLGDLPPLPVGLVPVWQGW